MLGLIVLIIMGGYFALSIFLVLDTYKSMKKKGRVGRKAWMPAVMVGLVMYLLVFWDHIPTIVAHKYYCDKYAGFTVYKTVEEWKAGNPGVAIKLKYNINWEKSPVYKGDKITFILNQRIKLEEINVYKMLGIKQRISRIIDQETNSILASRSNFSTDIKAFTVKARSIRDYKSWMAKNSCEPSGSYIQASKFKKLLNEYRELGENNDKY